MVIPFLFKVMAGEIKIMAKLNFSMKHNSYCTIPSMSREIKISYTVLHVL